MALYLRPERLEEALDALGSPGLTVLAGGTDFYPARVGQALDEDVLDITALAELQGIHDGGDHWRLGAGVTWSALREADLPPCFDGLKAAAREIGGLQIQNAATVVGNLCNASPAADGAPNLMALDATVELAGAQGRRSLPVEDFITGNRETQRRPDELATAICIPKPAAHTVGSFAKLGARLNDAGLATRAFDHVSGRHCGPKGNLALFAVDRILQEERHAPRFKLAHAEARTRGVEQDRITLALWHLETLETLDCQCGHWKPPRSAADPWRTRRGAHLTHTSAPLVSRSSAVMEENE
jgi:hypothetical protein